jgi:hypothetical protein
VVKIRVESIVDPRCVIIQLWHPGILHARGLTPACVRMA